MPASRRSRADGHALQTGVLALLAVLLLLFLLDHYRRELSHSTGDAAWIWVGDDIAMAQPTVGLFSYEFELSQPPLDAVAKVAGDQQLVLWVNGLPAVVSRRKSSVALEVVPVTDLLRQGSNVILLEVRSSTSVGGVLFALDLKTSESARRAGDPSGRNAVVSGAHWRRHQRWTHEMPGHVPLTDSASSAFEWGRPPMHPWGSLRTRAHARPLAQSLEPVERTLAPGSTEHGLVVLELRTDATVAGEVRRGDDVYPLVAAPGQEFWVLPSIQGGALDLDGAEGVVVARIRRTS